MYSRKGYKNDTRNNCFSTLLLVLVFKTSPPCAGIFNIKTDCRPIGVRLGVALADRLNHCPNNFFLIVSGGA